MHDTPRAAAHSAADAPRRVYFNQMQREAMLIGARDTVIIAGRGTGKGLLHAATMLRNFQAMPRSTTAIIAPNAIRAKTNTIPSMTMHWEAWGYRRDVHWVIGRRPPASLHWDRPLIEPESYDNVISFYNGSIAQIISQDRAGTSNSKSFDFIDIDEAKFIDFEQLKNETFQANRGQQREFGRCPWHHGMLITSDMPTTTRGSWFLRYERSATPEAVALIEGLQAERSYLGAELRRGGGSESDRRRLAAMDGQLAELRRHALLYKTYSSLTNMAVLGEDYIRQQRRDLPPLIFQTSILCIPVRQMPGGFYSSMTEAHIYTAANLPWVDRQRWGERPGEFGDCRADADLRPDEPLAIAFDFNRNINWLVCGQPDELRARMNTLHSFYVKYERKLPELIADFARYYQHHATRSVIFYYDSTAIGSNYAVNDHDFRWVIETELTRRGWAVTPVYIGHPMNHADKHLLINQGFAGRNRLTPYFNQEGNRDLLVSIQTAGVYNGKKDKRGEKLAETEEDRLEARTDGSDAWDTLYIGLERFPAMPDQPIAPSSNWA